MALVYIWRLYIYIYTHILKAVTNNENKEKRTELKGHANFSKEDPCRKTTLCEHRRPLLTAACVQTKVILQVRKLLFVSTGDSLKDFACWRMGAENLSIQRKKLNAMFLYLSDINIGSGKKLPPARTNRQLSDPCNCRLFTLEAVFIHS